MPRTLLHSPITWWNSTYAVPGTVGDAIAPMIASVARAIFSCSDSNQRSRIGRAAPVRISSAAGPSRPSCRNRHPREHRFVARQRFGVALGEFRDLLPRQLLVGPHQQEAAVGERGEG